MRNALRHIRGESQKNIIRLIEGLSGRYNRWDIWQDFIIMSATAIANTMGGPQVKAREELYRSHAERYSAKELEVFADMLFEVVAELERDPEQDFLGELFMALGLGNEWKGQFFTPYDVCRAMSAITSSPEVLAKDIQQRGWVSVNENADKVREMLGDGAWGSGAPEMDVRHGFYISRTRQQVRRDLSVLDALLRKRMNDLGYDPYWQRFMCMNWDDVGGCSAGCTDCDSCTEFRRIRPQYCARCGGTFYERKENRFCAPCRTARKKQAQRHWCRVNGYSK